ncbi:MAG: hypothetical protein AB7O04_10685 [Hyphomonadaceae bacterium]
MADQPQPRSRQDALAALAACACKADIQDAILAILDAPADFDCLETVAEAARREGEGGVAAQALLRAIAAAHDPARTLPAAMALFASLSEAGINGKAADGWLAEAATAGGLAAAVDTNVAAAIPLAASRSAEETALVRLRAATARAGQSPQSLRPQAQSWVMFAAFLAAMAMLGFIVLTRGETLPTPPPGLASRGFWLAALYLWAPALLGSWLLALNNARRAKTTSYVSPFHVGGARPIAGQHPSFNADLFYHIFQFVWFPILGYLFVIELNFETLAPLAQAAAAREAAGGPIAPLAETIGRIGDPLSEAWARALAGDWAALLVNEQAGLAFAFIAAVGSLAMQAHVQRTRIDRRIDFFWWDIRTGLPTWLARWVMVGVDMGFGAIMLQKVLIFMVTAFVLLFQGALVVDPAHADGFAGLAPLRDAVLINAFGALVLGFFVMSSWYLHRDMPQYRASDSMLALTYAIIVILIIATPAWRLEHVLSRGILEAKLAIMASLAPDGAPWTVERVEAVNVLRGWNASLLELNALSTPLFGLAAQAIGLAIGAVRRQNRRGGGEADALLT